MATMTKKLPSKFIKRDGSFNVKVFVKVWLAALRSGKYKQDSAELKTPGGYCCLGVACDVMRKEKLGKWDDSTFILKGEALGRVMDIPDRSEFEDGWEYNAVKWDAKNDFNEENISNLSDDTLKLIKLDHDMQEELIALNDGDGDADQKDQVQVPFPLIADMIEAYYKAEGVL